MVFRNFVLFFCYIADVLYINNFGIHFVDNLR